MSKKFFAASVMIIASLVIYWFSAPIGDNLKTTFAENGAGKQLTQDQLDKVKKEIKVEVEDYVRKIKKLPPMVKVDPAAALIENYANYPSPSKPLTLVGVATGEMSPRAELCREIQIFNLRLVDLMDFELSSFYQIVAPKLRNFLKNMDLKTCDPKEIQKGFNAIIDEVIDTGPAYYNISEWGSLDFLDSVREMQKNNPAYSDATSAILKNTERLVNEIWNAAKIITDPKTSKHERVDQKGIKSDLISRLKSEGQKFQSVKVALNGALTLITKSLIEKRTAYAAACDEGKKNQPGFFSNLIRALWGSPRRPDPGWCLPK